MDSFPQEVLSSLQRLGTLLGRGAIYQWALDAAKIPALDRPALTILMTLRAADEPMRIGDVARRMRVEGPHVTRHVNSLHGRGYVERLDNANDRRARPIRLTDDGARLVDRYLTVTHDLFDRAVEQWGESEQTTLIELLRRLLDGLEKELDELGLPSS